MKTILVIGANSATAKQAIPILAPGNKIMTAGRSGCDVYCDITKKVEIPDGVDVVINFAAAFGRDEDTIFEDEKTNALGVLNICMAVAQNQAKHFINISSLSVLHKSDSPFHTAYAISKRHGDELAEYYCQSKKIALTILRPSQIYGDDINQAKHQPFIADVVKKAAQGEDITIFGQHDAKRNYIHAADLAETIRRVIDKNIIGIYDCMYPTDDSFATVAEAAQKVFGKGGKVIFLKDKPDIPDNVFPKDTSIYEKIDFWPQISIEAGMARIKQHYKGQAA